MSASFYGPLCAQPPILLSHNGCVGYPPALGLFSRFCQAHLSPISLPLESVHPVLGCGSVCVAADDAHAVVRAGIIYRTGAAARARVGLVRKVGEGNHAFGFAFAAVPRAPAGAKPARIVPGLNRYDVVRVYAAVPEMLGGFLRFGAHRR